jgi:large repetitive protein
VGMTGPSFQGQDADAVSGRPTTEGTYEFTVQVTDSAGATDTETFDITIIAPRTLTITNPSVDPGAVNRSYWVILRADGGVPGYLWSLRAGTLPPGLKLTSGGDVAGTPSAAGTYSFTAGVSDSLGTTATRTYSITIS